MEYVGDLTLEVEDLVTSGGTRQLVEEEISGRDGNSASLDVFCIASDIDNGVIYSGVIF